MDLLELKRLYPPMVFIGMVLGGCATTEPIPEMSQPRSAAFGIDVAQKAPIGFFTSKPDQVYFVRVDAEGGILQDAIVRSNYVKDGRAYLLNARLGTYVAVATFFARTTQSGPPQPGFSVTMGGGKSGYTTYLPKDLVERTRVTVAEGDFAFMGSYVVQQSVGLDGADAVQKHYKDVIAPGASTNTLLMGLAGDAHYRGTLAQGKSDEQARSEFLTKAKEDLGGSAWAARIK